MNTIEFAAYPGADERTADDWTAIEARFQRAKEALRDTQQRHGNAAHEFLLARAQVRQMLETVFPGAEAASHRQISEIINGRAPIQTQEKSR